MTPIRAMLDAAGRAEWDSLRAEGDPRLRAEGLISLATRLERSGREAAAAELYREVGEREGSGGFAVRARVALDALLGRGAAGPRAEFLFRRLAREAADPAGLFALAVGGTVFRGVRLAGLGGLALRPASLWTRGLGARILASFGATLVEAPVFTLSGRLANAALDRGEFRFDRHLAADLASSYLVLGGMRLFGGAGGLLGARIGLAPAGYGAAALRQGFQLAGLMFGHRLEQWTGLRPHRDGETMLVDSLAMLLQLQASGRLVHQAFGEPTAAREAALEARLEAERLESGRRPWSWEPPSGPEFAIASAVASAEPRSAPPAELGSSRVYRFFRSGESGGEDPFFENFRYVQRLLQFTWGALRVGLRGERPVVAPVGRLRAWLGEAERILDVQNRGLAGFAVALRQKIQRGSMAEDEAQRILSAAEGLYTRLHRAHFQLAAAERALEEGSLHVRAAELRRRLDWVAVQPEFNESVSWEGTVLEIPDFSRVAADPYRMGLELLRHYHPNCDAEQLALYDRAALGPIRGRDLAFDLDKTLGDTFLRYLARDAYRRAADSYDLGFDDFVNQFTRIRSPYRGMQAVLLGLWAAGNRLRLYTASENLPGNHDTFFNDFPLLKVAFNLVPPERAEFRVTPEFLHASEFFMDGLKRREFQARYFETEGGREFLDRVMQQERLSSAPYLKDSKIPFPDYPFEVLVDDLSYFAGEMMTLGVGRRWVEAPGTALGTLVGLEQFFAKDPPSTSELWREWLRGEPSRNESR